MKHLHSPCWRVVHVHICLCGFACGRCKEDFLLRGFPDLICEEKHPGDVTLSAREFLESIATERYLYIFTVPSSLRLKAWVNDVIERHGGVEGRGELVTDLPLVLICLRSGKPPPSLQDICSTLCNMNIKCWHCVFLPPFLQFVRLGQVLIMACWPV